MTEQTNPQELPDEVTSPDTETVKSIADEIRQSSKGHVTEHNDYDPLAAQEARELFCAELDARNKAIREAKEADEKAAREREAERQGRELVAKRSAALKRQSEENAARRSRELEQRRLNEIAAAAKRQEVFRNAVISDVARQQRNAFMDEINADFQKFYDLKFGSPNPEPNSIVVEPEPEPWSPGLAAEILKRK